MKNRKSRPIASSALIIALSAGLVMGGDLPLGTRLVLAAETIEPSISTYELNNLKNKANNTIDNFFGLTQEQKNTYKSQINDPSIDNKEKIDAIVEIARKASSKKLASFNPDRARQYTEAINAISDEYLSHERKEAYIDELSKAITAPRNRPLDYIYQRAVEEAYDNRLIKDLSKAKEEAQAILNQAPLSKEEKEAFQNRINNANNTLLDYEQIKKDITESIGVALRNAKITAIDELNNLKYLTVAERENAHTNIDESTSIGAVNDALNAAKELNSQNRAIVANAKDQINSLANIDDKKTEFLNSIDNANNQAELNQILAEAKKLSDDRTATKGLEDKRQFTLEELSKLANLKEANPEKYQGYVTEIVNATSIDQLDPILQRAEAENKKITDDKNALANIKNNAIDVINALANLSEESKEGYKNQVNDTLTLEEINPIVEEAINADNQNRESKAQAEQDLADARLAASKTLAETTNFTAEQNSEYQKQIEEAETVEALKQIESDIRIKSDEIRTEQENISQAHKDALEALNNNANVLPVADFENFLNQITAANTVEEYANIKAEIVKEAQQYQDALKERIEKSKEQFEEFLDDSVKIGYLSQDEANSFKEELANANTIPELSELNNKVTDAIEKNRIATADDLSKARTNLLNKLIDNRTSLSEEQFNEIRSEIYKADNLEAINDTNSKLDSYLLDNLKNKANDQINQTAGLPDADKIEFREKIERATSSANLQPILDEARSRAKENITKLDLEQAKVLASDEVDGLGGLDQGLKNKYNKSISNANNVETVNKLLDAARKQSVDAIDKEALKASIEQAIGEVEKLPGLSTSEKEYAIERLKNAVDRQAIPSIVAGATITSDAKLNDGKAQIDKMDGLTDADKTNYKSQIETAANAEAIDEIINSARNDASNQTQLQKKKEEAVDELNKLDGLTNQDKQEFTDLISTQTSVDSIDGIIGQATARAEANKAQTAAEKALVEAKEVAIKDVNALDNLSADDKKFFTDRINDLSNIDDIKPIVDETREKSDKNFSDLINAKTEANNTIGEIEGLSQEEKDDFINQIEEANSIENIDSIVEEAKKKAITNGESEANEAANLQKAKDDALTEIAKLQNLTDKERQDAVDKINEITKPTEAQPIVEAAIAQDDSNKAKNEDDAAAEALAKAKADAINEVSGLENLSAAEIKDFTDRINNQNDIASISPIVDKAKKLDSDIKANNENAKLLEGVKKEAKNQIQELVGKGLTQADADNLKLEVDNKTTADKVSEVVTKAQDKAKSNNQPPAADELRAIKDAAIATIDGLKLDQASKNNYKASVEKATQKSEIDAIVEDAIANQNTAPTVDPLRDDKDRAISEVSGLNLSQDKRDGFNSSIEQATSKAEIDSILEEAKGAVTSFPGENPTPANDPLKGAKDTAIAKVNSLNLSPESKGNYNARIEKANDQDAIDAAVANAKAEADQNTEEQAVDTLIDKKDAAKVVVNELPYLEVNEKQAYNARVEIATDANTIDSIIDEARNASEVKKPQDPQPTVDTLRLVKDAAQEEVNNIPYLQVSDKIGYNASIEKATTEGDIKSILAEANIASDKSRPKDGDSQTDGLRPAKNNAKEEISKLNNLSQSEKNDYNAAVEQATSNREIDDIVALAKVNNNEKPVVTDLSQAKAEATRTINALSKLTDNEKANYIQRVGQAQTGNSIDEIVAEAKRLDNSKVPVPTDTLDQYKSSYKKAIENLPRLTDGEKSSYKSQIDQAKKLAAIENAYNNALSLDKSRIGNVSYPEFNIPIVINSGQYYPSLALDPLAGRYDRYEIPTLIEPSYRYKLGNVIDVEEGYKYIRPGNYIRATLIYQRDGLQKALDDSKQTVDAVDLLFRIMPKTSKVNKAKLIRLVQEAIVLQDEAKAAIVEIEKILENEPVIAQVYIPDSIEYTDYRRIKNYVISEHQYDDLPLIY